MPALRSSDGFAGELPFSTSKRSDMDTSRIQQLEADARGFREAIERCRAKLSSTGLSDFPAGACGEVADLLGIYLVSRGFEKIDYVTGYRSAGDDGFVSTHAWLEVEGIRVDITADQFPDGPDAVIVSRVSSWHDGFSVDRRRPPGSSQTVEEVKVALDRDYQLILGSVDLASGNDRAN